jgi:hypothetical protein
MVLKKLRLIKMSDNKGIGKSKLEVTDKMNAVKPGHKDACVERKIEIRIDEENTAYIVKPVLDT